MSFTHNGNNEAVGSLAGWKKDELETTAALIAALAHPLRLAIVHLLSSGERSASDICDALWSSQPNVSRHLSVLHNRKVVRSRKEASRIYYSLRDPKLFALISLNEEAATPAS
ncbi:MAG: ArsR family transcriptional regulator [Betaproteobacteria bacterium HGW-Betaproteobacteria-7]|jgi:ArsR family transcriptional regulator|nr:MAG: ArsR family transcriptional regulator [Betaproteobacteria bacterium HGW-Betaproteobacteria-7]